MTRKCIIGLAAAIIVSGLGLSACAGQGELRTGDPLTDILNPDLRVSERIRSTERALRDAEAGRADAEETRRVLKVVAWARAAPVELRLAVIEGLFAEPDKEDDSRALARYLLPHEKNERVVRYLAEVAVARGWVDVTPSLVRCYAQRGFGEQDDARPEHQALLALHPGTPIDQIVFEVFLDPRIVGGSSDTGGTTGNSSVDWTGLTRADAWDLLARLDADGTLRAELLFSDRFDALTGTGAILRADLKACVEQLHTIPLSAAELTWLRRLRHPQDAGDAQWWTEAAHAVGRVSKNNLAGLRLRHVEPIRWAAAHRPEWLLADREELMSIFRSRLDGRRFNRRSAREREGDVLFQERLSQRHAELRWADLLALLVIDEALSSGAVRAALFEQAAMDQADRTTEYGGVLASDADAPERFDVTLFPPRPASRLGDDRFVASADLIRSSDAALAHYHFHVQRWSNARFAGPSRDDLVYAWRQGRSCLVLSGIRRGVLGVDYYQPDGVIVDLGEIRAP